MSMFLNTLSWWQWLLMAAIPAAIILLYFLKLKRQPLVVPSTYLWSRTIEDLHVNTIWQRLRRNILLLLQLLLIFLLMLALLRPAWRGTQLTDQRFIFLLDQSASMSATDQAPSRLVEARRQAVDLIDQMTAGNSAMVIAFSDQAQVMQAYTESRRTLRRQVEKIQPTARGTNLNDALRAAAGLANPGTTRLQGDQAVDESLPATMYIFSDGGFQSVPDFSLGNLTPIFVPIGQPGAENVGIVAFATDRNPEDPQRMQAFCSVANFGSAEQTVLLELFVSDQSVDLVELTIAPGKERGWHFDLPDLDDAVLRLEMHHEDALLLDNTAYSAINRTRRAQVLVATPGSEALQLALHTEKITEIADVTVVPPEILTQPDRLAQAAVGTYDLMIYDRCQPPVMPQSNTLFLGALPPDKRWTSKPTEGSPVIVDIDHTHPLTQLLQMSNVVIAQGETLTPPTGSTPLFDSQYGPLFAIGPRDGFEDAVLGFPLLVAQDGQAVPNSTWPLRPSFPVFIYNVVRYLGGSRGSTGVTNVRPGDPVTLRSEGAIQELTVTAPDGRKHQLKRDGRNTFVFTHTGLTGVYQVRHGDTDFMQHFVVNLFSTRESNIEPQASIELGHETVNAAQRRESVRREFWKWILIMCLGILGLEWYVYHRRVHL